MKSFLEYITEAAPSFHLGIIFDELNEKMFDPARRLPDIPISFGSLPKGVAGITQYKYNRSTRTMISNSMFIKISPLVTTENAVYSVVAHEMIHARLALDGYTHEGHGPRFVSMAKQLSAKIGVEIALNHEFTADDLESAKSKKVAAVINQTRDGKISFCLISDTKAQDMLQRFEAVARAKIQRGDWTSSWFGIIDTKLYKLYPVSRTLPNGFYVLDKESVERYGNQLSSKHTQFFHIEQ